MQKIPTLFERDWDGDRSRVLPVVHDGCEWVAAGEGVATRKYDGTCCLVEGGRLFKRYEVKPGKPDPSDFTLAAVDDATGKRIGWRWVTDGPDDRWHREAWEARRDGEGPTPDGTYELVGPKIQGNPEGYPTHTLIAHADAAEVDAPHDFDELAEWFEGRDIEGVVWHHPDGRMAKIKGRDFGIRRPKAEVSA